MRRLAFALIASLAAPLTVGGPAAASGTPILPAVFDGTAVSDGELTRQMEDDLAVLTHLPDRVAGTFGEHWAAVYLKTRLRIFESETVPLAGGGTSENVWRTIGRGKRHVLLGAHYDTVAGSPGADDNASGVVVLLGVLRRLDPELLQDVTVTFAFFGAEEYQPGPNGEPIAHHQGSRHRAAVLADAGTLPDLMVSVDMVGVGSELFAVTYLDTETSAAQLLGRAGARAGVRVNRATRGDFSDHEAFARRDVPSVFMWRPDNPGYHTPDDTMVSPDALLADVDLLIELLELAADRGVSISAAALGRYRPARD